MHRALIALVAVWFCSTATLAAPTTPPRRTRVRGTLALRVIARDQLVRLTAGETPATQSLMSLRRLPRLRAVARQIDLLKQRGVQYEQAYLSSTHVALVRKGGVIDVMRLVDAAAQIKTNKPIDHEKLQVGTAARGRGVYGEHGPNDTIRLYRQLPALAAGQVASTDHHTSFALSAADAYHPFGKAGRTVTLAVPRRLFERALSGELGGSGWTGGGIGIDVIEEVQIESKYVKALVP